MPFILILSVFFTCDFWVGFLPQGILAKFLFIKFLSHLCHITCLSLPPWFHHPNTYLVSTKYESPLFALSSSLLLLPPSKAQIFLYVKNFCKRMSMQESFSNICQLSVQDKWVPVTTIWRVLRLRMEQRLPIWRVAENILDKKSRTAYKGWSSSLGVGGGVNNSSP